MPWYAVRDDQAWIGDTDDEVAAATIWTVSRDPKQTGWNTDSGNLGYGLTKDDAEFLAQSANAAERADVLPTYLHQYRYIECGIDSSGWYQRFA